MILVVDDEAENRTSLMAVLERDGHACLAAASGGEALELLRARPEIRLLITDLKMPGVDGLELLAAARHLRPEVARVLVTAFGTIEDTVSAMKAGAFDVLTKPLKLKNVRETVQRLMGAPTPTASFASTNSQLSPQYARVMETLRRAASSEASVLFTGESGTGKSYLAETLHQLSTRRNGPFIALNCAAIPAELLESELFGFEKGAFTGAVQSREGKIGAAENGTLLLDEIGDLSPALQAKLLQFIQTRKFFRLGSNKETTANVRIVAATNRPLDELVKTGRFREDLLYRLKVVEISVPPLRQRKQDLLWLVPALLDHLSEKNQRPRVRLSYEAFARAWHHDWPGNIRELENSLESSLVLASDEEIRAGLLEVSSLRGALEREVATPENSERQAPPSATPNFADLATLERRALEQALVIAGGNRKLAAHLLGVSERTLYRMLEPASPRA